MENQSIWSSLRFKIALYILVGAVVFSTVVILVTSYHLKRTLTDSLVTQGKIVAASIGELSAERIIEEDQVGLKNVLEKYRYYLSNEYIIIVDSDYNIVADTYNGQVPDELLNSEAYSTFDLGGEQEYIVDTDYAVKDVPVYDIRWPIKEGLLGFVRVGLRKSFVDEQIQTTLFYIGLIIAIGTFAAIIVALLIITVQVTRPVIHLANAAQEISLGNFKVDIQVNVKNELQMLAAAIERMKESLRTSLERLKTRSTIGRF